MFLKSSRIGSYFPWESHIGSHEMVSQGQIVNREQDYKNNGAHLHLFSEFQTFKTCEIKRCQSYFFGLVQPLVPIDQPYTLDLWHFEQVVIIDKIVIFFTHK